MGQSKRCVLPATCKRQIATVPIQVELGSTHVVRSYQCLLWLGSSSSLETYGGTFSWVGTHVLAETHVLKACVKVWVMEACVVPEGQGTVLRSCSLCWGGGKARQRACYSLVRAW